MRVYIRAFFLEKNLQISKETLDIYYFKFPEDITPGFTKQVNWKKFKKSQEGSIPGFSQFSTRFSLKNLQENRQVI